MESLKERFIKAIAAHKRLEEGIVRGIDKKSKSFKEFRDNLIESNLVNEEDILLILSQEYRMPYLDLDKYRVHSDNKDFFTQRYCLAL